MDFAERDGSHSEMVFRCRLQEATCHALIGETTVALRQLHGLLADERRVFGDDDARVLELRRQIGLLLLGAGHRDEAEGTLRALLDDLTPLHGPDHATTAKVRNLLASTARRSRCPQLSGRAWQGVP